MSSQVQTLLQNIETELKQAGLWSGTPPSAQALASVAPFCCDTLSLPQWLEFVLLPRMQALLDANMALPDKIAIFPYAELAFAGQSQQLAPLLAAIKRLDAWLNQN
ncbi:YqcC family protein [Arsukibacterium sp.]|uniref:YqcC family protein n=1 Tax=Arsukibacterium sp. TaxID=1977258 RepID=UPI002FDB4C8E